jgi:transporter family-2 protein
MQYRYTLDYRLTSRQAARAGLGDRRSARPDGDRMRIQLYALTMFFGVVLAVHLAMNGAVGALLNNPRVGNALFWVIGATMAVVIGVTGWRDGALAGLGQVNPILLTAGAIGACLVFGIGWLIPQIGASSVMFGLLAGQIVGGMVLSHFGWLGSPVQPISPMNLVGVVLMVAGVVLATRH